MDRTALYRHFDKDKNLLYVGISYNAFARLAQHEFSSTTENRRTMQAELEMILDEYFEQKKNQEEQQPCNQQQST